MSAVVEAAEVTKENYAALTHFEAFGVDPDVVAAAGGVLDDASLGHVRKRFRRLGLQFHQDKDPSQEARDVFIHLKAALEVLLDPDKLRAYAQSLRQPAASAEEATARTQRAAQAGADAEALRAREAAARDAAAAAAAERARQAREAGPGRGAAVLEELRRGLLSSWEALEEDMLQAWEVGPEELDAKEAELRKFFADAAAPPPVAAAAGIAAPVRGVHKRERPF